MEVHKLIDEINKDAEQEKSIQDFIRESLIPQGITVPKPDLVFGLNGIPIFTKKSISTLIGKAKSGKTTVTSWVVSQSIQQEISVLWIDTEQGLYYGSRTQHWILTMSGMQSCSSLQFYDLKTFNPSKRVEMIELIIQEFRPELVVVDGIRDLVFDINSPEEATLRTGDLMRWADHYDCHIMNILHQNKGNEHARGHLGTEMINKSETVMKVEQNEDKVIVCSPEYTRSEPFESFAFDRDDKGMPQIIQGYSGKVETESGQSRRRGFDPWDPAYESVIPEIVEYCLKETEFVTKGEMCQKIGNYFKKNGVAGTSFHKVREFADRILEIGIVWENKHIEGRRKFHKNPKYVEPLKWKESERIENLNPVAYHGKADDQDAPF